MAAVAEKPIITEEPVEHLDRARHLATLIRARRQIDNDEKEVRTEFKARREAIENTIARLAHEIEFGQERLPLLDLVTEEPKKSKEKPSDGKTAAASD